MKAKIRKTSKLKARRQKPETAPQSPALSMRAIIGGASRKTWEGLFLKPEEDQHPHVERLDEMTESELRIQAWSLVRAWEENNGKKERSHWLDSIRFELWLIAELAKRKDLKL